MIAELKAVQDIPVGVVIPVCNDEAQLASSVEAFRGFLQTHSPYCWQIIVANNASTDRTPTESYELGSKNGRLREENRTNPKAL